MTYLDRALIKLKRQYSKDELVAALSKQLKDAYVEIGQLKSEIDEISYRLTEDEKTARKESKSAEKNQELIKKNKKLQSEVISLRKSISELTNRLVLTKTK